MAGFKFDTRGHASINDNAMRDLPLGKHNYEIEKIEYVPVKSDKSGKRHHLIVSLRHSEGGKFSQFLEITPRSKEENEVTRARIASEQLTAYARAAGFDGIITPAKFKVLCGKPIGIETVKTVNKATKAPYINISQIVADGFSDEEADTLNPESDSDEEEEEEEEEAPKETTAQKKKRLAAEKKAKAAAAAAEEEDEDEDEEEDDEDEDSEEEDEDDDDEDPFA